MIILNPTTDTLEVVTGVAVSTDLTVDYEDHAAGALVVTGAQTNVSTATTTTLVSAPSASHQRQVKCITVHNNHASTAQVVTIQKNTGTVYTIVEATLQGKEALHYFEGVGWQIFNATGQLRSKLSSGSPIESIRNRVGFVTASLGSTKTLTSTTSFAYYVGKAGPGGIASIQVRVNVTTAYGADGATAWAEFAIATGAPVIGGNASLTTQGYTDVSATINSTGRKTITITVTGAVAEGDDVWIIFANKATTPAQLRADSIADDLTSGYQAAATTTQPSTMGAGTTFTVEGATVLAVWFSVQ